MRFLVGCECSGRIRAALRNLGVDAWSCDLKPSEDNSPFHIQADVLTLLQDKWDRAIFHPDCTYLCNSGVRWLYYGRCLSRDPERWQKMKDAAEFFLKLWNCPIPKIAIENPVMHHHALEIIKVKATQFVQPWMFGDPEKKATGLWLRGFSPIVSTAIVMDRIGRVHLEPPGPLRKTNRSRTPQKTAEAFAFWLSR